MSLIPLAAHLIRLAATDAECAQDLRDAVFADDQAVSGLVEADVQNQELAELTSTQWQWYASWRQELGGDLSRTVLDHLTANAATRFARFEVRELVLRDPPTNQYVAAADDRRGAEPPVGLTWLSEQAQGAGGDEAIELMDDALQCATDASWFLLRQLTSLSESRGAVRRALEEFANAREISAGLRQSWGIGEPLDS